jgi:energy-converting hydrogenase Eha subunit A
VRLVLPLVVIEYEQRILIMILRDHPIEVAVLASTAEDRPNHFHLEISIVFPQNIFARLVHKDRRRSRASP